ncbi:Homeobox protein prophet of Pit-1, partial [Temnothorax longispinosus]
MLNRIVYRRLTAVECLGDSSENPHSEQNYNSRHRRGLERSKLEMGDTSICQEEIFDSNFRPNGLSLTKPMETPIEIIEARREFLRENGCSTRFFSPRKKEACRSKLMEDILVSDIIQFEYGVPRGDNVRILSGRATARQPSGNYVETLSGVFSKRPTLSFVGARVYDVAAVGIMRLTRDYTAVEILRGRSRTAAALFFERSHWSRETWGPPKARNRGNLDIVIDKAEILEAGPAARKDHRTHSPGAVGPVETRRGEGPLRLFSWYPSGVSPEAPSDTQVPRRSRA